MPEPPAVEVTHGDAVPPLEAVRVEASSSAPSRSEYILFLPGAAHGSFYFERMQALVSAEGYASVALTFDHANGARALGWYCRQVLFAVLQQPAGTQPVLWGHSLGAQVAMAYLAAHKRPWSDARAPEGKRAKGLVLWSPVLQGPGKKVMLPQLMNQLKTAKECKAAADGIARGAAAPQEGLRGKPRLREADVHACWFLPTTTHTSLFSGEDPSAPASLEQYAARCRATVDKLQRGVVFSSRQWVSGFKAKYGRARDIKVPSVLVCGQDEGEATQTPGPFRVTVLKSDITCPPKFARLGAAALNIDGERCTLLEVAGQRHCLGDPGWEESAFAPALAALKKAMASPQ